MTPFPYSVDIHADVGDARAMMKQHSLRHLPVTEAGALVGVVSERDVLLLRGIDGLSAEPSGVQVAAICSRRLYAVDLETPVEVVADELADRSIGSAVVLKGGKLVGIVTVVDLCRYLAKVLRERFDNPLPPEVA